MPGRAFLRRCATPETKCLKSEWRLKAYVSSDLQPRLRTDWIKPLLGAFVCFLLFRLTFIFIEPVVSFLGGRMMGLTLATLLSAAFACALSMAIFESRKLTELGLAFHDRSRNNFLIGAALGIGSAGAIVLIPVLLGRAHFQRVPNPDVTVGAALFTPVLLFCGAMGEEMAFRGFILQYLARGWGLWAAILTTSVVFGLLHSDNPGATWISALNTALFGVVFGIAVLRTHELWLPIGIHFGWNLTLPFLGAALSGLTIRVTGFEWRWNSGDLFGANLYWSGGSYGPEASLLTTLAAALLAALLLKLPLRRGWARLLDEADPDDSSGLPAPESSPLS
jgi:membrane protease YdiL (CAAX protease family)